MNREKDDLLCFVYLPQDNSPFYEGRDFIGLTLLENELLELNIEHVNLIIAGNLNAELEIYQTFLILKIMSQNWTNLKTFYIETRM